MGLWLIHSRYKKQKNPIDRDFRIAGALCPGVCHGFMIRLLAIVTLVSKLWGIMLKCQSCVAFQASVAGKHAAAMVLLL